MSTRVAAATDLGLKREHNEDSHLADEGLGLFVVADGMGGHACGEVASALALRSFRDFVQERSELVWGFRDGSPSVPAMMVRRLIEDALHAACREVWHKAQEEPSMRGMGTTLVALLVAGERSFVVHVGDSRAYLVRSGAAVQLTRDHSVLNELIRTGEIEEASVAAAYAPFRNALSRAVGVCEDVEVDSCEVETLPGDVFVVASDGLTQYLKPGELDQLAVAEPQEMTAACVALARDRGGSDNITVIVVRVEPNPIAGDGGLRRADEFARKIAAFRAIPVFRRLDYGELIRVLSVAEVLSLSEGERVQHEGQDGDALYAVLSGSVALTRGDERIAEFGAGAHFGEVSLVDRAPRSATATVLQDSRLLRLRREQLHALVRREPDLAVKLLWSFAETLGDRSLSAAPDVDGLRAALGGAILERR
jgi:serine/threonine protein phosphatase PrpC